MRLFPLLAATMLLGACVGDAPKIGDGPRPRATPSVGAPSTAGGDAATADDGTCSPAAVRLAAAQLDDLYGRWADASAIVRVTPRLSLAGPVAKLQDLRREADRLPVPSCLRHARYTLARGIEAEAVAMLLFMSNGTGEATASAEILHLIDEHRKDYVDQVTEAAKCMPRCPSLVAWEPPPAPATTAAAPVADGPSAQPTTSSEPVVVDAHAKVTESNETWARFAWQASVRNPTTATASFTMQVDFIDSQHYTIDHDIAYNLRLGPGETRIFTGDTLVRMPGALNVDGIHAWVKQ